MSESVSKHNFSPMENKESGVRLCFLKIGEENFGYSKLLLNCLALVMIRISNQTTMENL